ncbi:unnamed protein product [Orchesella dallaii]|uniref:Uncharacterized protein n=1 Tax=Orchesella dallaii TaxID=48710 RepID=A0ABP1S421_9HEXA
MSKKRFDDYFVKNAIVGTVTNQQGLEAERLGAEGKTKFEKGQYQDIYEAYKEYNVAVKIGEEDLEDSLKPEVVTEGPVQIRTTEPPGAYIITPQELPISSDESN